MGFRALETYFSRDYSQARERFTSVATGASGKVTSYYHPRTGRFGEDLSTEIAVMGDDSARNVLMVQSGTHGVEGYCGSAMQIAFLEFLYPITFPANVKIVLVHAINPYGFSWCSRGDENNIDLNRNFIDFADDTQKQNDLFHKLEPHLVPSQWTDESINVADANLEELRKQYGEEVVSRSLRKGQYSYPQSLFYGGAGPSWSRRTVEQICDQHLMDAEQIIFLDVHSGLGDYGQVTLLSNDPKSSEEFCRLQDIFGGLVRSTGDPGSGAANAVGNMIKGYSEKLSGSTLLGVGVEFGTYEQTRVQKALRADCWLIHSRSDNNVSDVLERRIKEEMLEVFCPEDAYWRESVLKNGRAICEKALNGLQRSKQKPHPRGSSDR